MAGGAVPNLKEKMQVPKDEDLLQWQQVRSPRNVPSLGYLHLCMYVRKCTGVAWQKHECVFACICGYLCLRVFVGTCV